MAFFGGADQSLQIVIKARDEASKVLNGMTGKMKKAAGHLKTLGSVAGVAGVAIGVASAKMAMDFSKSMGNVSTLIDTGVEDMDDMKQAVIEMSKRTPVALDDLSSALYDVRSAGTDAAIAMEVLENAAKLGVAGLGTTKESADLLTTAINAFGLQGRDSAEVADILFKTVKAGKTDIAKLSQAFGKMAGNAKAAGVEFEDVQAATAALTALTGKTSEAQNALAQVFLELTVQGGKLDKGLQENGASLDELNEKIGEYGLARGMKIMQEELGLTETEFKNLFSSAEGGTSVFQLLTDAYDANNEAVKDMKEGQNKLEEATKKQKAEAWAQAQMLKNELNAELIDLGNVILPVLLKLVPKVTRLFEDIKIVFGFVSDEVEELTGSLRTLGLISGEIDNKMENAFYAMEINSSRASGEIISNFDFTGRALGATADNIEGKLSNAFRNVGNEAVNMSYVTKEQTEVMANDIAKLPPEIAKISPEMEGVGGAGAKMVDAFEKYTEKIKDFGRETSDTIVDVTKKIGGLEKKLSELRSGYAKEQNNERMQYAEQYLMQEQRVADAQADLNRASSSEARIEAMNTLSVEQRTLEQYSHLQEKYYAEIAYLRGEAAKSEMQRAVESIQTAGWKALHQFKEEEIRIRNEIVAETNKLIEIKKIQAIALREHDKFLALQELHNVDSINRQIGKYNELAKAIARAAAGQTSGLVGQSAGTIERATQTVEPYQGGVTVNINNPSVRDDSDIDKMRDMMDDYFRTVMVNNKITA